MKTPHIAIENENIDCGKIPNFGDYRPNGYELVDKHFVDSSGFGRIGEAALTIDQFQGLIKKNFGYAIIEEGQFQLYIGEFKKK